MKILSIYGGPRKKGNTATVLGWIEDELTAAGHEVGRINLSEKNVQDCIACFTCREQEGFGDCAQKKDDGNEILKQMMDSHAILVSSPLYCWSFTAKLHALFNRAISLVKDPMSDNHRTGIQGKLAALLITAAGPFEGNADLAGPNFDRICNYQRMKKKTELILTGCTAPDALDDEVRARASAFVAEFTA
ncbi:MAG: flavodoxin family protein [Planctomycetota bacterium]|jgi:multimeric flavodoxin WrbA